MPMQTHNYIWNYLPLLLQMIVVIGMRSAW